MDYAGITRGSLTSQYQIEVIWTPLVTFEQKGGSEITSYNLQYDRGIGDWTDIVGSSTGYLQSSVIVTEDISAGTNYLFRVRARNIYGFASDFTDPTVTIRASDIPD